MKKNKNSQWLKLDNAAKLFPAATDKQDTKVFRFVCELKETVDEKILQAALDKTLEEFPIFCSVMRKGLFWYYLESSERKAKVHMEDRPVCSGLYDANKKNLLFDISYYRYRINLEAHHSLTDGTGAMTFLQTLVFHYLMAAHKEQLAGRHISMDYDASALERNDDSFGRYFDNEEKKQGYIKQNLKVHKCYRFHGVKLSEYRLKVVEGSVPVEQIKQKAKEYHTTITVFLTALLLCSISETMTVREKKKPVGIAVPVNLRNFFRSESARNFFGVIDIFYDFGKESGEFTDVIKVVEKSFLEELTTEKLKRRLNKLGALERNPAVRVTPVIIKDFFMNLFYKRSEKSHTFSLSNIGTIVMPEELEPYIQLFDVFISTKKQQACLCSFQGILNIAFTSPFLSTQVEKEFFRKLSGMGMTVTISVNPGW